MSCSHIDIETFIYHALITFAVRVVMAAIFEANKDSLCFINEENWPRCTQAEALESITDIPTEFQYRDPDVSNVNISCLV